MHRFLQAVGFGELNSSTTWRRIADVLIKNPDWRLSQTAEDGTIVSFCAGEVAPGIGVMFCGEEDDMGEYHLSYYYPYFRGDSMIGPEETVINRRMDTEAFTGMCDDMRIGVSLIFYLQNPWEYRDVANILENESFVTNVQMSGLSLSGKILLGAQKREDEEEIRLQETKRRDSLIAEAKKGNPEAIDSLTMEDIDTITQIHLRAMDEDLYSIIDTTFIPFGSESDNYSVIGIIEGFELVKNRYTDQNIWKLQLLCNGLTFDVCIREKDLLGEPAIGRRFKGNIWMQGTVLF
ncbi:MAG: DUF3881 family protein [Lachnospiraceae bacterium]|nr:DUF3881 family protein [Lachnospiraceae bacterium]